MFTTLNPLVAFWFPGRRSSCSNLGRCGGISGGAFALLFLILVEKSLAHPLLLGHPGTSTARLNGPPFDALPPTSPLFRDRPTRISLMSRRAGGMPSLSVVSPLDVLRQKMMFDVMETRLRNKISQNNDFLKSIGKRSVAPLSGDEEREIDGNVQWLRGIENTRKNTFSRNDANLDDNNYQMSEYEV